MEGVEILEFKVHTEGTGKKHVLSEASIKIRVGEEVLHTVGDGNGPVHALDLALERALFPRFPFLAEISLVGYEVHILNGSSGTDAKVRVATSFSGRGKEWETEFSSTDIIHASLMAIVEGLNRAVQMF